MNEKGLSYKINKHIQNSLWLYILCLLCLCIGIVIGIYCVKYMNEIDRNSLTEYFKNFGSDISTYDINHKALLMETIKSNIPVIVALWFLGLTMVGVPVILILDIIKGYTIGYTISLIISSLGIKGIWFSLLTVIPQNIIYIPCIMFCSVISMKYSIILFENKSGNNNHNNLNNNFTVYSIFFILITAVMFIGFLYEVYVTPGIITFLINSIGSGNV